MINISYGEIIPKVSSNEESRCTIDELLTKQIQDITKKYVESNAKFQICCESHREGDSLPFEYTGTSSLVSGVINVARVKTSMP